MFHRMLLTVTLALGLAACVETDATTEPSSAPRAVPVEVSTLPVEAGETFALAPDAICGRTFCGGRPLQTVCYCPLGSGLWKASTCALGCSSAPPPDDPTD